MAIATGTVTTGFSSGSPTSLTVSHTAGSGLRRVLIVHVAYQDTSGVNSVTYAGTTMTVATGTSRNFTSARSYYLVNPATGANNVVVTFSGATAYPMLTAIDVTDADQTSPIDGTGISTGTASPATVDVTTGSTNSLVFDNAAIQTDAGDITLTVGAGQTQRSNFTNNSQERQGTSTEPTTTPTTVTMSWTESASRNWAIAAFGIKEQTTSPSTDTNALLMGIAF